MPAALPPSKPAASAAATSTLAAAPAAAHLPSALPSHQAHAKVLPLLLPPQGPRLVDDDVGLLATLATRRYMLLPMLHRLHCSSSSLGRGELR